MDYKLRKWEKEDIDALVENADNYNIAKYLTDQFPHPYTFEDGEKFIDSVIYDDPVKVFAIEIDGKAAGSIGIFPQNDIHRKNAEIGYWLAEQYWGNGIISRAICEICGYGFNTFDIIRIFARPFSINKGSQKVLEKAGFKQEAILEKAIYKNGEFMDEIIYSKVKISRA